MGGGGGGASGKWGEGGGIMLLLHLQLVTSSDLAVVSADSAVFLCVLFGKLECLFELFSCVLIYCKSFIC